MIRAAARRFGPGGVDGGVALLDIDDLPFLVDYKRGAVRNSVVFDQNPVSLGNLPLCEIAEQRDFDLVLGCKFLLGRSVVSADSENLSSSRFEFSDTSLVRRKFARSTTREGGREEGQDHRILAPEIAQFHLPAGGGGQGEVRGHIPLFQMGLGRLRGLAKDAGGERATENDE